MMRRRLEAIIPIVLFAIVMQLMAPIAAFRAVANAVSDPLYMATICSGMASMQGASVQDASPMDPATTQQHGAKCCAYCGIGHGGTLAVDPPPLVFVTLQRQFQLVSWLEAEDPEPRLRAGSNAQARAPPTIS